MARKHKEYLKGYPDTLPYIDSRKWHGGVRNYPLIDCAKAEANAYINGDIDAYLERYPGNDVRAVRIEVPWQVGANLTDRSRFGGLVIMYIKEETSK